MFLKFNDYFSNISFSGDLHKLISELRSIENSSSISDDITYEILEEMEKMEREKGNKGRKKNTTWTENNNISDDNDKEIEVNDESNEEEIEDDEPIVAMQNCWSGLSLLTAEEDVVNQWYGCIFLSKGGPNLFTGKATQRLPKYEDGLIMVLKIDCFEQKLGTTD